MTNKNWLRGGMSALLAASLALGATACGSSDKKSSTSGSAAPAADSMPGKGKPPITIGDKNFTEQFILGELYSQALKAKGYRTTVKSNIGSSEITDKALTSGKIDMYPEYTGVIDTVIAGNDQSKAPKSAKETYAVAKAFQAKRGFTTFDPTPFADADGLAVKPAYAQKYGLKTAGDLTKAGSFTYGGPPENKTRFEGVVGMKKVYKLNKLKFKPLTIGLQYKALDTDKIDVAAIFTTDGQLSEKDKYTLLPDTKGIFGFQNVTPVVKKSVADQMGPEFAKILNSVSSKLTNDAMQKMNAAVDLDKQKPAAVASAFLKANGLS